jgi:hypothetical protein
MKYGGTLSAVNCNKTVLRFRKVVVNLAINHRGNKQASYNMIDECEQFV